MKKCDKVETPSILKESKVTDDSGVEDDFDEHQHKSKPWILLPIIHFMSITFKTFVEALYNACIKTDVIQYKWSKIGQYTD